MSTKIEYVSKTQHYLKVKKPLLERERRARMNKYLDELKILIAEFQGDDAIFRMDKAEMLESAIDFVRNQVTAKKVMTVSTPAQPMDCFCNGYMNAVNEVSRVMAATPEMSVELGKSVMTHLGGKFNRLLHHQAAPISPASSGYHSDCEENSLASISSPSSVNKSVWRPW